MNLNELNNLILKWGHEKGILPNPIPEKQLLKTQEEVDELVEAVAASDIDEVKDAIGDIVVTLIMQCEAWGLTLEGCVESAYSEIADRQGKMVNGIFVKEG